MNHPYDPHGASVVVNARWIAAQEQISACKHCIHSPDAGATCHLDLTHPVTTAHARAKTGRCGPEASMMWGRTWGTPPDAQNRCLTCGRPPFGIGCCHCHR